MREILKKIELLGEYTSYLYIISAFINSKLNMKLGYLLVGLGILKLLFWREKVNINKRVYGMFSFLFVLGIISNFIVSKSNGINVFINENGRFFYAAFLFVFLSGKDKLKKEFAQKILTLHCDGASIFIGRNNRQNDFLTTKKAKPFDYWFHVKNRPGSHVILSCGQDEPTNKQLQTAAECAAWYSTGRDDSKVEVDSTMIKHVKKPSHSVPGYVIFDHQTTYVVTPKKHDELSK